MPPESPPATDAVFDEGRWSVFLTTELDRPVRVTFGRALRQVIVARVEGDDLAVRMNAFFAQAPAPVRGATARWLRSGKRARAACRELDSWIAEAVRSQAAPAERRPKLRTQGRAHDLADLARELFEQQFAAGALAIPAPPGITWGRRGRARHSLLLGSYDPELNIVRVHPVLDQPGVPTLFVRYVLFHELLHAAIREDPEENGRRLHHGPRFRECERAYPEYEQAIEWQDANLGALLRSARSGNDMSPRRARRVRSALAKLARQGWLFPC